jgi:hypothetical protein
VFIQHSFVDQARNAVNLTSSPWAEHLSILSLKGEGFRRSSAKIVKLHQNPAILDLSTRTLDRLKSTAN